MGIYQYRHYFVRSLTDFTLNDIDIMVVLNMTIPPNQTEVSTAELTILYHTISLQEKIR